LGEVKNGTLTTTNNLSGDIDILGSTYSIIATIKLTKGIWLIVGCATLSKYSSSNWGSISGSINIVDNKGAITNNYKTAVTNQTNTFSLNVSGTIAVADTNLSYGLSLYCSTACSSSQSAITFRAVRIA
jgi:hypothetical protein